MICRICKEEKEITQFLLRSNGNRRTECRVCNAEKAKQWRIKNPVKYKKSLDNNRVSRKLAYENFRKRNPKYLKERYSKIKKDNPNLLKAQRLKWKYGISLEEYTDMLDSQDSKCAICKKRNKFNGEDSKLNLYVDHCHKTNKIRGLLCQKCNSALGLFHDDIKLLEQAINYLRVNK